MREFLRSILWPFLLLLLFVLLALVHRDLLGQLGFSVAVGRSFLAYFFEIGVWFFGFFLVVRVVNVFVWDRLVAPALKRPVPRLLKDALAIVLFGFTVMGIVGVVFEQSITAIWATSSVFGIVLGLALRNIILDVFTGLAVNLDRSYGIGDWVEIHGKDVRAGLYGRVIGINWRTTRIELEDRNVVVLPNSTMGTAAITNYSLPEDLSRAEVLVTLQHAVPPERAIRVLLAGAKAAAGPKGPLDHPEPVVLVGEINLVGVMYRLRFFLRLQQVSFSTVRSAVLKSVLEHLQKVGLAPALEKAVIHSPDTARRLDVIEQRELVSLLSSVALFQSSLRIEEIEEMAQQLRPRFYKKDEVLIQQGAAGESMFVLTEGLVYVYTTANQSGERIKVAQITPGQTFGEMSLLTGEPRSATVVAATDVVAFELSKEQMQTFLQRRPEIAEQASVFIAVRRLGLTQALANASVAGRAIEHRNVATEILGKMKEFFAGVFGRSTPSTNHVPVDKR